MKDPIGAFDTIKDNYIRYIKTAFRTKFDSVEQERESLLNQDRVLYREPWIEILPEYKSSGFTIASLPQEFLPGLDPKQANVFKELVSKGLTPDGFELYSHQAKMLKAALERKNCIITSGTGSGKTESFLLPLIAQISKELANWEKANPEENPVSQKWWKVLTDTEVVDESKGFVLQPQAQQRKHETRPAAMRALILYPMNALVEDQMSRLRFALDSRPTREWLKKECGENKIYFGRYNGATPVPGKLSKIDSKGNRVSNISKVRNLKRELSKIQKNAERVQEYIEQERRAGKEVNDDELRAFFQQLDGSEMRCRFDMQLAPPDILITNFSMLSIMLMRDIDSGIFEKTRQWLACEDIENDKRDAEKKNRVFHLIIDELHLYRGTPGTEISYLVKLMLYRLGLHSKHPQLRILASSASLEPGDEGSFKYISDFFGFNGETDVKENFEIITGEYLPVPEIPLSEAKLPYEPFVKIAEAFSAFGSVEKDSFVDACAEAASQLKIAFDIQDRGNSKIGELLYTIAHPNLKLRERMYKACKVKDAYRAVCSFPKEKETNPVLPFFFQELFGNSMDGHILRKAGRGLLIAREMLSDSTFSKQSSALKLQGLPRFRFHYFMRNIEGLWASLNIQPSVDNRTAGKLFPSVQIGTKDGYRVLELLYCDNCGTLLFGGSRGKSTEHSFEMLPVTPNIEGIPDKTTAKLVEKRTYQEYAVFWPCGDQEYIPHDPPPNDTWSQKKLPGVAIPDNNFEASWVPASLNKFSGQVNRQHKYAEKSPEAWIKGYLFKIVEDNNSRHDISTPKNGEPVQESHRALPCVCPACGIDETKRIKFTPIRGFRTGFAKTTQILAKELMYQLPGNESQRKLVVFSDSREDAAQIANGIERNHYNDLLREIVVREMHNNVLIKSKIALALKEDRDVDLLKEEFPDQYDDVSATWLDATDTRAASNEKIRVRKNDAVQELFRLEHKLISVQSLIKSFDPEKCAPLVAGLIEIGANPAGLDIAFQKSSQTGNSWEHLFDFLNNRWKSVDVAFQQKITSEIFANLASLFFGNLFYSLEASGLGYLTVNPDDPRIVPEANKNGIAPVQFIEILNASIRILGHKYFFWPNDSDYVKKPLDLNGSYPQPAQLKKYLKRISELYGLELKDFWISVKTVLVEQKILRANGLQLEELFIKVASENDPVWISERGKRIHLHRAGGVCTQYPESTKLPVDPSAHCIDIWDKNYLSYHAAIEKRKPVRLHCEELTGQTDDQYTRQRHFRNIILNDEGERKVKQIDLLSVTTTLEVGVDIGSLQAVMLANMPPQRFNYQQRVGRAGRRGQAYSVVLTFCRGRSHDDHYFSYPEKITGDPPPTPFLTPGQPRILKRLIAKEILRQAFKAIMPALHEIENDFHSVHGDFGVVSEWSMYRPEIRKWIEENAGVVREIVIALKPGIDEGELSEFIGWITKDSAEDSLMTKLEAVISNKEIASNEISEKLAEGGVLPMFGMPTSQKELYHEIISHSEYGVKSINRDSSLAIYEFAPGAQKTKDKAIHTALGFTTDLIVRNTGYPKGVVNNQGAPFYNERWMIHCDNCGAIRTEKEDPGTIDCKECNLAFKVFQIKSPIAYRTDYSCGEDSKENVDIILSRPAVFAEPNIDSQRDENAKKNFKAEISDQDVTWRVNTNGGNLFQGRLYSTQNYFPFNRSERFAFDNQWLLEVKAQSRDENGYKIMMNPVTGKLESIALAANKKTEVFRLHVEQVNNALNLDMHARFKTGFNGIRSAYYSAAFLLQRVLADQLDVDPTEIEIADIRRVPGLNVAEIVLTDELPNGSGFVRVLFNQIEQMIDKCISLQKGETYLATIHADAHLNACQDACYDCLKGFRNMNYHGLLDWKLATSLLHAMNDSTYQAGADGNFGSFEIKNWVNDAHQLAKSFRDSFPGMEIVSAESELPVITTQNKSVYIVVIHPLWDCYEHHDKTLAFPATTWLGGQIRKVIELTGGEESKIRFIDTFNLHRRLGWCYQKLFS